MWLDNSAANTAQHFVRTQVILLYTFVKLSVVPQGMVPGHFIYDVFINDICISIKHSKYFLFVYVKIVGTIISATDCTLFQSYIDSLCGWCVANNIMRSTDKIRIFTFTEKTN